MDTQLGPQLAHGLCTPCSLTEQSFGTAGLVEDGVLAYHLLNILSEFLTTIFYNLEPGAARQPFISQAEKSL